MNETRPVRGILISHGALATGLLDAVRQITGIEDALVPVSNKGLSPDALAAAIVERLDDGPAILFTDMASGSCGMTAHRLLRDRTELTVISGVNLPLLLDFAMNRTLPIADLVPRLLAKGRGAIGCAPVERADADRTVARG